MPLDHDDRCNMQDQKLAILTEQARVDHLDLLEVIKKLNVLIAQRGDDRVVWAEMGKDLDHIKEKVDKIEHVLDTEVASKSSVEGMQKWWTIIASAIVLAVVGAAVAFVLRGGLIR